MPLAWGPREAERAQQLGMEPYEFAGYIARLREDYKSMLPSSLLRPRTVMGMGMIPLLVEKQDIAKVGFGFVPPWLFPLLDALAARFKP